MTMLRKLIQAEITDLGEDEVEVVMSTAALARDGHILVPQGCQLENYRANPIVLWSHDPDKPVGNAENVAVAGDKITARVRFAPTGISHKADEIRGLTKAGVIRAVSVGFDPIDMEPLDPRKPKGGQRIGVWQLLELSFVSVPADPGAVVTARAHGDETMPEITEGDVANPGVYPLHKRGTRARSTKIVLTRGFYQIANLASLLEDLGWQIDMSKYEAAIEGDGSQVPAMLAQAFADLSDALLAMTQEEIAEALAGHDVEVEAEDEDEALIVAERQHIAAATNPAVRAFRRAVAHAKIRAGKSLSADTVRCLREAKELHEEAMGFHRSAMRKHKDGLSAIDGLMDRAGVSDPDSDATQTVQTSGGTGVDEGSEGQRELAEFRRRQAEILRLALPA